MVSPFPAGDHKAHINRRTQNIANTRQNKNIKDPQKKYRLERSVKYFTGGLKLNPIFPTPNLPENQKMLETEYKPWIFLKV